MNVSLVNLTCLIQKLLEENKKNSQDTDLSNLSSSNNIFINADSNSQTSKNKSIEVNKKIVNSAKCINTTSNLASLRKNITNQILNNSPINNNYSTFYSNIHMSTMSNLKGLSFSSKWNKEQDERNNKKKHIIYKKNKN